MLNGDKLIMLLAMLLFGAVIQVVVACGLILHSVNQAILIPDIAGSLIISGILTLVGSVIIQVVHYVHSHR